MPQKPYRYTELIAMSYIAVFLTSAIVTQKFFRTPLGLMSASSIISPLWFILNDIIAEVYGYKKAQQLFYTGLVIGILFSAFFTMIRSIDSQSVEINFIYHKTLGGLLRSAICDAVAIIIAWKINIFLLLRWKFLLGGHYFWLRSLGGSMIMVVLYSVLYAPLMFIHVIPLDKIMELILHSCLLKIVGLALLAYPSQLLCTYLKKVEHVDLYEKVKFNPFASRAVKKT